MSSLNFLKISNFSAIARNSGWMITEKIAYMLFGLFVGVWVARFLGPSEFGVINYAQAIVALLLPFAAMGLNHIITRDLVEGRDREPEILGTTFVVRLVAGAFVGIVAVVLVYFLRNRDTRVTLYVAILSIAQVFRAFVVLDFWYQSYVRSKYVTMSRGVALVVANALKIICIVAQAPTIWFIIAISIEIVFMDLLLVIAYIAHKQKPWKWKFSLVRTRYYLTKAWPLILSGFAAVVYLKIDRLMIGQMMSDTAVGLYSAAARISEIWYVLPESIAASVFPYLLGLRNTDNGKFQNSLQSLYNMLAGMGLCIAVPVTILAPAFIRLLYGSAYLPAAAVLRVHIWACIFVFMRALFSKWIISEGIFKVSLLTHGAGAVINVILNLVLIPVWGILGAAVATLISYTTASYIALFFYSRTKTPAIMMTKAIIFPVSYLITAISGKAKASV